MVSDITIREGSPIFLYNVGCSQYRKDILNPVWVVEGACRLPVYCFGCYLYLLK